jgi:SulP family sulfate permease
MITLPIASAIKETFKDGYTIKTFRADLSAGIVVSLVALPLSMALAIAIGLPPQHGLYTAIVAGIVTAILGGSRFQVTGPTAAFVAILAPIVAQYGLTGLIWCQLIAGCVLILMGGLRLGKYVEYVPYAVTTGFTAGIAVVIATLSLNDFFGMGIENLGDHYWEKVASLISAIPDITPQEAVIGIATFIVIMICNKFFKTIPGAVVGIVTGTGLALIAVKMGMPIDTIATRFSYVSADGSMGAGIPPDLPRIHIPPPTDLMPLIVPAMTIAALAALESLLSATVADNITKTRHNPNAELTGAGFGNLFSGLIGGIPATGALARTATNIHAGAKTPFAAVIHSILLFIFMVVLAQYISEIPMAALAALLLVTAIRMAHMNLVLDIVRAGNQKDTFVLFVTFFLTIIFDMVVGVASGLALSYVLKIYKR